MLLTITINSSKKFDSNSRTVKLSNLENSQDATRQSFLLQNKTTKTRKRSKDILESPSSKLSIKEYILLTIRNNVSKFPKHFQNCRTSWTTQIAFINPLYGSPISNQRDQPLISDAYPGHSGESFCSSDLSLDGTEAGFDIDQNEGGGGQEGGHQAGSHSHHGPTSHEAPPLSQSLHATIHNPIDKLFMMQSSYFSGDHA